MKVLTVVGTRPEIIRLSRTIPELDASVVHVLVHTGQNHDPALSDVFFADFALRAPDHHLGVAGGTPGEVVGAVIARTDAVLEAERPDAFLVLGDTNSCLSAIAAKRRRIPVFHVEAGNRCYDDTVPEEVNRRIIDHASDVNIAYSGAARRNLLAEGLHPQRCLALGSPLDEVLRHAARRIEGSTILRTMAVSPGGYFLASLHRAETVDEPARLGAAIEALEALGDAHGRPVLLSAHPRTRAALDRLGRRVGDAVRPCTPFGFFDYVRLEKDAACVLSDSGSLAEEASLLGFPAVALRRTHERLEAMDRATTILAGHDRATILPAAALAMRHAAEGIALGSVATGGAEGCAPRRRDGLRAGRSRALRGCRRSRSSTSPPGASFRRWLSGRPGASRSRPRSRAGSPPSSCATASRGSPTGRRPRRSAFSSTPRSCSSSSAGPRTSCAASSFTSFSSAR